MISIKNVKKTYFKNKPNEIKAIDDVTLDLPSTGFITILGPSGSGKTTLLNVIGGLDKIDSGSIKYDELTSKKEIKEYYLDHIGVIFQNYLLIENQTVLDNLLLCLDMLGINDQVEMNKRIQFTLESVGLYKFRHKLVKNLSGGQKQRVAIARALLKNTQILIADEPTGNLDRDNTVEVMNILKAISKTTLVILVTHNPDIARYYSDQIINYRDGKVVSIETDFARSSLSRMEDNKIYLKDLNEKEISSNIKLYQDTDCQSEFKIIIKNNTIYIDSLLNVVSVKNSNIEVLDLSQEQDKLKGNEDFDYDSSWYDNSSKKKKAFNFDLLRTLKQAVMPVKHKKLFTFSFALIGIFLFFVVSSLNSIFNNSGKFFNEDYYYVGKDIQDSLDYTPQWDYDSITKGINDGYISNVMFGNFNSSSGISFYMNPYKHVGATFNDYIAHSNHIKGEIIEGDGVSISNVVIGNQLADDIIKQFGGNLSKSFLVGLKIQTTYIINDSRYSLRISGIASDNTNTIYVSDFDATLLMHNNGVLGSEAYQDGSFITFTNDSLKYNVVKGRDIQNDHEILVSSPFDEYLNTNIDGNLVVGVYSSEYDFIYKTSAIANKKTALLNNLKMHKTAKFFGNTAIEFKDKEARNEFIKSNEQVDVVNINDYHTNLFKQQNIATSAAQITFLTVLLTFGGIYIFFIMRARIISSIKSIAIYLALGASKRYLTKKYALEIVITLIKTTALSYLIACLTYNIFYINVMSVFTGTVINFFYLYIAIIPIILLFLIIGLIPLWTLLGKTPVEISKKYDI